MLTLLRWEELLGELGLHFVLFVVLELLFRYALLQVLDLVESTDEVLLEVILNVVGNDVNAVVYMVDFAEIQFVLDERCQLLVVIRGLAHIYWTLAFHKRATKRGLEPEELHCLHLRVVSVFISL